MLDLKQSGYLQAWRDCYQLFAKHAVTDFTDLRTAEAERNALPDDMYALINKYANTLLSDFIYGQMGVIFDELLKLENLMRGECL